MGRVLQCGGHVYLREISALVTVIRPHITSQSRSSTEHLTEGLKSWNFFRRAKVLNSFKCLKVDLKLF
jgi:hypothetical protein